jgi:hypothetical protein
MERKADTANSNGSAAPSKRRALYDNEASERERSIGQLEVS